MSSKFEPNAINLGKLTTISVVSEFCAFTQILAATTARRLAVVDVERGEQLLAYDNCAYGGRERSGLATDPVCPNMAVSVAVNGKGLTLLDLRMPLPLDFVYDVSASSAHTTYY